MARARHECRSVCYCTDCQLGAPARTAGPLTRAAVLMCRSSTRVHRNQAAFAWRDSGRSDDRVLLGRLVVAATLGPDWSSFSSGSCNLTITID